MFREKNGSRREEKVRKRGNAYRLLEFSVFLLCVDEVKDDVERAGENEGEEETESGEVRVALRTAENDTVWLAGYPCVIGMEQWGIGHVQQTRVNETEGG